MAKIWTSNGEFETARDYVSKLVLIGSVQRAEYLKLFQKRVTSLSWLFWCNVHVLS